MDDYWNISETASCTLDNFFDEECDINWTGKSKRDSNCSNNISSFSENICSPNQTTPSGVSKSQHKTSLSSGSLSSIIDNISINSDSGITGIGGNKAKVMGRAIGEKIEALKPSSVSLKWKNDGSGSCLQCNTKDEEIIQLRRRLERAYSRYNISLPPQDTIHKIMLGNPYSLESYRIMEDKLILLDLALGTMDSSTILDILLFLRNTMKKTFFLKELQVRPLAVQIYISYLKQRLENAEVLDILGMLGRNEEAAMFKYELALSSQTNERKVMNLKQVLQTHFADPSLLHEAKMVQEHINLLEIQSPIDAADSKDQNNPMMLEYPRASSLLGQPLLTSLYYSSMYHWQATENLPKSPLYFKKQFNVSDKQFLWTVIRARAKVKHWPLPLDLENLMGTKGLMGTLSALSGLSGGGKIVKNTLPVERVIDTLASTEAPSNVLSAFITLLSSNENKLRLGLAYGCHLAVVEAYVGMKDKDSLEKYLKQMTFGSAEYIKADQALKNSKWK